MQDADATMRDGVRDLLLDQIVEPWVILRTIDREAVEYLELRDSLADKGLLNSIGFPSPWAIARRDQCRQASCECGERCGRLR